MSEILDPKTGPIDRLITRDEDIELVKQNKKTATRRNGRYANPGEVMELAGQQYEITNVYKQSLGDITDLDAQAEGFTNLESYKQSILATHPGMPWLPHVQVWVHEFRKLEA